MLFLPTSCAQYPLCLMQSLVEVLGPAMDPELEAFVPLLLKRAGQVRLASHEHCDLQHAQLALIIGSQSAASSPLGYPSETP